MALGVALDPGGALGKILERQPVQSTTLEKAPADYRALALAVRDAGLLRRRPGYYFLRIAVTVALFAAGWVGLFLLGNTWTALALAAGLGLLATQIGFLGHDAGHQQVFRSRSANRYLGLLVGNLLIGVSFGWWVPKHNAHHAHPNQIGRDPDIGEGVFAVTSTRVSRFFARKQAVLFFPLMLLRSVGLHVSGAQLLWRRRDKAAGVEAVLLTLNAALYLVAVFWVLSPLKAIAFLAVQQGVFSFYLGCSFAPNHKAMPIVADGAGMDFAERQVLTSRNVTGGRLIDLVLGGLNYQIEHHLFPTMPRPNLRRAQRLVRGFCQESGLGYGEASVLVTFGQIIGHLRAAGNSVGGDPGEIIPAIGLVGSANRRGTAAAQAVRLPTS